jgi:RNA ligase (TIGR02306 family)
MPLATIRKVEALTPIEGADRIEVASIGGWNCIVKKGEFQVGDLGVYFEIDSFLPEVPQFEFLRKSSFKTVDLGEGPVNGFRIKTMKMKGVVSQGLLLPISDFGVPIVHEPEVGLFLNEGDDVTEVLGVKKYEKPIPVFMRGKIAGNFPWFLRKTDQERCQNLKGKLFGENSPERTNDTYEVTLKLDGSSMTVYGYTDPETGERKVGVCSRNLELKLEDVDNPYVKVAIKSGLVDYLYGFDYNFAFQGELVGPGVQANFEQHDDHKFYVFDIFNIDENKYLRPEYRRNDIVHAIEALDGRYFDHVPVLATDKCLTDFETVEDLLAYADGKSINAPVREGVVFKSNNHHPGYHYNPFTFKVVSNKYLTDYEE